MPTKPVFIRAHILEKLVKIAEREGLVTRDGKARWHYVLNELLESAIALYESGMIKIRKAPAVTR